MSTLYTYGTRLSPRSSLRRPRGTSLLRIRSVLHQATNPMKPAAIYTRVSTGDQNPEIRLPYEQLPGNQIRLLDHLMLGRDLRVCDVSGMV
jgi:hypothetical protein